MFCLIVIDELRLLLAPEREELSQASAYRLKHDMEVHSVGACWWVILDAMVDVLLDVESKALSLAEVPPEQFVLLDLEAALKQVMTAITISWGNGNLLSRSSGFWWTRTSRSTQGRDMPTTELSMVSDGAIRNGEESLHVGAAGVMELIFQCF